MMHRNRTGAAGKLPKRNGFTLIEVLIAMLILAFGMLGTAAMQAVSLRNNSGSLERSQAIFHTYSMLDAMRANVALARTGGYNVELGGSSGASALASADLARWQQSLAATLGSGASGSVACVVTVCSITVQWDDSRGTADMSAYASAYNILTVSQL